MMAMFPFLAFVTTLQILSSITLASSQTIIAINPDRLQLMKDALSWFTFRRKGELVPNVEVEKELLHTFKSHYTTSKFYRTFIIAFHQGVLPKLTLQENEACDPTYVAKYKNPVNNMVYWHGQKKITFESYKKRNDPSIQYCDYRQGLVCNPSTSKCECREGSSMSPIAPGSPTKRCLLGKNEICAITDFDQGSGPNGFRKYDVITKAAFNLEKPEGCQMGLQCRSLDQDEWELMRCYDSSTDPSRWAYPNGDTSRIFMLAGHRCSLGVMTTQGSCLGSEWSWWKPEMLAGSAPGYFCYNFGPPRDSGSKGKTSREGFCAHELGSWQIMHLYQYNRESHYRLWTNNFIMGFVNRRSVPLTQEELLTYYKLYIDQIHDKVFPSFYYPNVYQSIKVDDPCYVAKTDKMVDIWKFYSDLEKDPPPGANFSVTKKELDDKLEEMRDLVNGTINDGKFCKVFWSYTFGQFNLKPIPSSPLRCVKTSTASGNNDGTCQVVNDDSTKPFAEKVQQLSDYFLELKPQEREEEEHVDNEMLEENPEPACIPEVQLQQQRSLETLEGGDCPIDSICFLNYEDSQDIYDWDCNLEYYVTLEYACMSLKEGEKMGHCENKMLNRKIAEEVEKIAKHAILGRGEKCRHEFERQVRDGVRSGEWSGNKYKLLTTLIKENKFESGTFCDRTKLLECTDNDVCECVYKTNPRSTTLNEGEDVYQSEYCYLNQGSCTTGLKDLLKNLPLTKAEIEVIQNHYGVPEDNCMNGNVCVFLDKENLKCTAENTGITGHDLKPITTTTAEPRGSKKPGPSPLAPPRPYKPGGGGGLFGRNGQGKLRENSLVFMGCYFAYIIVL